MRLQSNIWRQNPASLAPQCPHTAMLICRVLIRWGGGCHHGGVPAHRPRSHLHTARLTGVLVGSRIFRTMSHLFPAPSASSHPCLLSQILNNPI